VAFAFNAPCAHRFTYLLTNCCHRCHHNHHQICTRVRHKNKHSKTQYSRFYNIQSNAIACKLSVPTSHVLHPHEYRHNTDLIFAVFSAKVVSASVWIVSRSHVSLGLSVVCVPWIRSPSSIACVVPASSICIGSLDKIQHRPLQVSQLGQLSLSSFRGR